MTPAGDLIEPGRYMVTAWKTRHEDEEGMRMDAGSPDETGRQVAQALRDGCYQIVVEDTRHLR